MIRYKAALVVRGSAGALVLLVCPVVALLAWYLSNSHGPARLLLCCYLLIAMPLYLMTGSYPPIRSKWFWKAMIPVAALIGVGIYIQVQMTEWFRYIEVELPARMAFGFTGTFALLEGWAALRIVDALEPKDKRK